jgi:hypothetical protein
MREKSSKGIAPVKILDARFKITGECDNVSNILLRLHSIFRIKNTRILHIPSSERAPTVVGMVPVSPLSEKSIFPANGNG